jgi:hypothetical protein
MRRHTRRGQLEESRRRRAALPRGPFGRVGVHGPTADQAMSMTGFFEYLHDHEATTDLAKALADAAMLRTSGARPAPGHSDHERVAS